MQYSSISVLISISLKINWDSKANQTKKSSIPWTCFLLWISQVILKHVFHLQIDTQVKCYKVFLTLSWELWCCSLAVIAMVHCSMRCPLLLVITSVWMAVVMYSNQRRWICTEVFKKSTHVACDLGICSCRARHLCEITPAYVLLLPVS